MQYHHFTINSHQFIIIRTEKFLSSSVLKSMMEFAWGTFSAAEMKPNLRSFSFNLTGILPKLGDIFAYIRSHYTLLDNNDMKQMF